MTSTIPLTSSLARHGHVFDPNIEHGLISEAQAEAPDLDRSSHERHLAGVVATLQ